MNYILCLRRSKLDPNTWQLTPRGQDWSQSLSALNMGFTDPTYVAVSSLYLCQQSCCRAVLDPVFSGNELEWCLWLDSGRAVKSEELRLWQSAASEENEEDATGQRMRHWSRFRKGRSSQNGQIWDQQSLGTWIWSHYLRKFFSYFVTVIPIKLSLKQICVLTGHSWR